MANETISYEDAFGLSANSSAAAPQGAGSLSYEDAFGFPPSTPKKRSLAAVANDTVIEAANAAAGGISSAANFVRPGNQVSGWIDKNIIQAGEANQSDVTRAAKQRFQQEVAGADTALGELGAVGRYVVDNPLLSAAQAVGSFVGPGAAVKTGRTLATVAGLGGRAVTRGGLAGGAAAGTALAGGDAAGSAYGLAAKGGATEDQAVAAGRQASVIPAVIGGVGGVVGAERLVAGAKGLAGNAVSRAVKTAAVEGAQEGIEEGVTQYEGQRSAMPYDKTIDPMKGVAAAAGMGAALGGATGAGVSLLTGGHHQQQAVPASVNPDDPSVGASSAPAQPAEPAIDPNAGPLSKAASLAGDLSLAQQPAPPTAQEQRATLEATISRLPETQQREARMNLADLDNQSLPAGVRAMRNARLQELVDGAPAAPVELTPQDMERGRVVQNFDARSGEAPPTRLSLTPEQSQQPGDGIDFTAPAAPSPTVNADEARIAQLALDADLTPGEPMQLNKAHALRRAAAAEGITMSVIPHPSGRGYDVAPTARLDPAARTAMPQDEAAAMLSFDQSPSGRMVASPDGVRAERRAEAVNRTNQPVPAPQTVASATGAPFASRRAAQQALQRQQLSATHEVVPAAGDESLGFVLQEKGVNQVEAPTTQALNATDSGANRAPNWRTNALQAGRVAREIGLDPKGKRLAQLVAEIDAADAQISAKSPEGAAVRDSSGQWTPGVRQGTEGRVVRPIGGAPTFSEAGAAAHWAQLEQLKSQTGADVASLVRQQDLLSPTDSKTKSTPMTRAGDIARGLRDDIDNVAAQEKRPDMYRQEANRLRDAAAKMTENSEPRASFSDAADMLDAWAGQVGRVTASTTVSAPEMVAASAYAKGTGGTSGLRQEGSPQQDRPPRSGPRSESDGNQALAHDLKAPAATNSGANEGVADQRPARAAAPRSTTRIEDFGETLHGARKMLYAEAYADGMAQAKELDTKAHPLSKTWPEPDYQKLLEGGAPVEAVSLARALREAVPTKPQSSWKLKGWATKAEALRGFAEDVLAGQMDTKTVEDAMQRAGSRDVANKAALYEAMGHERSLKGIDLSVGRYSMYDRVEYNPPRTIWSVSREAKGSAFSNWPRELAKGETREAAIAAFKQRAAELLAEDQAPMKGATFEIYGKRAGGAREFFIGKKIGRSVAELKAGFPDLKAARQYKADHQGELEDLLAKYKAVPPVRSAQNAPRIGEDYRKGADVTPEQFQGAFGFRGVQFGNYVEGARRQQDLNRAYDALIDLAGVLGLSPRALSLGGRLGLAFGARGTGGTDAAAAHYEPTTVVINLTKREGAGSLAHEWWHGLDNYFSRQRGDGGSFMTTDSRSGDGVREEMRAAFREVVSSINHTGMQERSRKLDDRRTKEYWTTKQEMSARAFESYVIAKLQDQNAGNDYLANVVGASAFALEGGYPYPTAGELPVIRGAFDGFFETVETRQGEGGATVLYNTSDSKPPVRGLSLEEAQQAVQQALAGMANPPPIDIVGRSEEAWVGAPEGVMGAALPEERRIVIVASAHGSADAVVETLFHEMFHLGLRNVLPGPDYVQAMLDLAKRDSRVQRYAIEWKDKAPDAPHQLQVLRERGYTGSELTAQYEALAIEEGLAVVAEELRAQKQAGTRLGMRVRVLAGWLAGVAERMGMQRLADSIRKMTYNEAERFVLKAIEHAGRAPISPDNADIRYRTARAPVESSMGQMTAVQERVWKKVAGVARVPTLQERAKALTQNIGVRAKQALVDQFAPIQDVSQDAYMLARMSKGADGTMEAAMLYGRPYLRDGVPDVDVKDGGFAEVLASLKGEHDRFLWWVAAQRADRLKAEGKENLMSIDDIGVLRTLNAGTMADGTQRAAVYAKAAAQLMALNESVLKMSLESGLIDKAAYDIMKEQPYVPFYRLMAEEGGMPGARFSSGLTNQNFAKKLKGGTEQLNADLLENLLLNWSHLYAATARNRAAVATMDAAEKMGVAYSVLEPVKGSVRVMRDGQAQHWMVEDPYLLEAISALHYTSSPLMKPLAKMKQLLTWGVTVNPTFKIRNLMRDSLAAIAQSELGYNPATNVKRGWNLTAEDSQVYASMLASGGVIKFGTQENTERAREQVKKLGGVVLDQKGWHKLSGQLTTVWNAYSELGDRLENVNRVALYDRLVAQGHSHVEASFMARDLMDFSMSGNHAVVRFLTQSVPFLNARLQGLYKLGRAAHDNPRRFAAVAGAVSLASLALLAAFGDDEDWKKREDWDRDSYWWFKIGEQAYRIPKPFEVGAIGTLAERTAELMFSDEMTNRRFMERLGHMLAQTFSFDPMPQAFKPLVDIYSNQDSFTGRAIESQADQRLRPEDRYDERTSEVARLLGSWGLPDPVRFLKGEWSELSPKQVDHLLRGYFSWAGTTAAAVADTIARPALDRGARPDQRLKDLFVLGNFVESLPSGSSRYVTQMYEQARQVEQAHASYRDAIKRGDLEKAEEIQRDEAPKLRQRPAYANATRQLSDLNQRAKAVTASKELSGAEKRAALDAIERQRAEVGHRMNALAIAP